MEKKEIIPLVSGITRYNIDITHIYDTDEWGNSGTLEATPDPEGEWMKSEEVIADRCLSEKRIEELEQALRMFTRNSLHMNTSKGESYIGWQKSDGPTANERQAIARTLLSTPK